MAGKPRGIPLDKQIALRLPTDLHAKLVEAAAGRSVTEQIRERLARSFAPDDLDPKTRQFAEAVGRLAKQTGALKHPHGWAIFQAALEGLAPKGEPKPLDAAMRREAVQALGSVVGSMRS